MVKKPTDQQKILIYEGFLHDINLALLICDQKMLNKLIKNANEWSLAHKTRDGEYTEKERQEIIAAKFWELREKEE